MFFKVNTTGVSERKGLVEVRYDLVHPDPEDVNRWLMTKKNFEVYGRYLPD